MSWIHHKGLWTNLAVALGFLGIAGGAGVVALTEFHSSGLEAHSMQQELGAQVTQLTAAGSNLVQATSIEVWKQRIEDSSRLASDRRERSAMISRAAEIAGLDLVNLRDMGAQTESADEPEDDATQTDGISRTHEVGVLGRFDQIAHFLDELGRVTGTVGIQDLVVRSAPEVEGAVEAGLLRGDLLVIWYALSEGESSRSPF